MNIWRYCGGRNEVEVVETDGGYVSEAHTYCWDCGWSDYFGYGFYEEYL